MASSVRTWLAPELPNLPRLAEPERRLVGVELVIVFAMTLGLAGLTSVISLLDDLLKPVPLNHQHVALNVPQARVELLDLFGQLAGVLKLLAWGSLGLYLLYRAGIRLGQLGLDLARVRSDLLRGAGLAALIGIPGLGLYVLARTSSLSLNVQPSALGDTWWRVPVLVLSAAANAWAEETLVVGYLITRLRQLGRDENTSLVAAAVLRGSYHLYQGPGPFVGNLVMGLVFGRVWQRTNRLWVLVVAHTLLDIVSFVGFALLAKHLSWLH